MDNNDALQLKKYDHIKVRKTFGKLAIRAFVLDVSQVGKYVVISYAVRRHDDNTMSGKTHVAVIGQEEVTKGW